MTKMHVQVGYDLRHVRHYKDADTAAAAVEKELEFMIKAGVVFNVLIVSQRRGGMKTNAEDLRYIPVLHSFRGGDNYTGGPTQAAIAAAWRRFPVFA